MMIDRVWLGSEEPPGGMGYVRLTPVEALSKMPEIRFVTMEYDVGDPFVSGIECLRVMRNAPTRPYEGLGIHESKLELRRQMVEESMRLFRTVVDIFVSDDGGRTYTQVNDVKNQEELVQDWLEKVNSGYYLR